jgi:hypothetical protein
MPDIGATLREARMRQHLDISEIEAKTKIRAKYLRALENEEWDLLPGDTFVRSFLRTYAETLGLDARVLLEDYKLRFQRPTEQEVLPMSSRERAGHAGRAGRRGRGGIGRDVVVAVLVVALVGVLILLGRGGGNGSDADKVPPATKPAQTRNPETTATRTTQRKPPARVPEPVALSLAPTDSVVWVCIRDADRGVTRYVGNAGPQTTLRTYHSKRFRVTIGNGGMNLHIDGRFFDVPESQQPLSYEIRHGVKPKRLYGAAAPLCGT